jgi:hypothetical protein
MYRLLKLYILILVLGISSISNAQRGFKYCKGIDLGRYDYMGQSAYSFLMPGDTVEHTIVLYANNAYKIFCCGPKRFGQIDFQIFDLVKERVEFEDQTGTKRYKYEYKPKLLFDTKDGQKYWETEKNARTRKILLKVMVPDNGKDFEDAIDILVGKISSSKKRFNRPRGNQW